MKPNRKVELSPEAYDCIPRVQVTLTDQTCWLTRFDDRGQPISIMPVSAIETAKAFNGLDGRVSTGLLPPDVLHWSVNHGRPSLAIYLPPAKRPITYGDGKRSRRLTLPMPGFVWLGQGTKYRIFALQGAGRPTSEREPLYHAPLGNVHDSGEVCSGNVNFPKCAADTIHAAAVLFWESSFNSDLSVNKVRHDGPLVKFLAGLNGKRAFPRDQLQPAHITLGDLISGRGRAFIDHQRDDDLANDEPDPVDDPDQEINPYEEAYGDGEDA